MDFHKISKICEWSMLCKRFNKLRNAAMENVNQKKNCFQIAARNIGIVSVTIDHAITYSLHTPPHLVRVLTTDDLDELAIHPSQCIKLYEHPTCYSNIKKKTPKEMRHPVPTEDNAHDELLQILNNLSDLE